MVVCEVIIQVCWIAPISLGTAQTQDGQWILESKKRILENNLDDYWYGGAISKIRSSCDVFIDIHVLR